MPPGLDRVRKGQLKNSCEIERVVIRHEILKSKDLLVNFKVEYHRVLTEVGRRLSFMDRLCFGKLLSETAARILYRIKEKSMEHSSG